MKNRIETLLWVLVIASIFAVSATDPWFYENWPRVVMIFAGLAATAGIGFLCGVAHGMKKGESEIDRLTSEFLEED
jgi:hypothetical protein